MHMISRRQFSKATLAAMANGVSALAAAPKLNIGIGTFSYHSLSLDEMIVQLKSLGIQEIEMSRGGFMLMRPPSEEMCRSARAKFDRAGIRCVSYYTATIKDERDVDYAVRFAKIFGASNVSGDATGPVLRTIAERFSGAGLTFGIHNHWFPQKFAYESVEDVLRGIDGFAPTIGATLDLGQMAACGHDPVDALRRLANYLKVVHLKDVAGTGAEHNVLLGQGIARIPECMRELKKIRFKGLVAIEYEKQGNADADVREEVKYARERA